MSKISKADYDNIAGSDWPSYTEYLAGNISLAIEEEIKSKLTPHIPIVPVTPAYNQTDAEIAYRYVLNSHPRGKNHLTAINNKCNRPWYAVTIDMFTNCTLCICDGWLPVPVGKITDFEKLEDIWNNPIASSVQESVSSQKFTNCAVNHCGILQHSNRSSKYQLVFGIDDSCNLKCPSCRRDFRMYEDGPLFEKKLAAVDHTVNLLNNFKEPIHIVLACSGDPLASHIYRPLLHKYTGNPNQTFTLFTNGLLIKKQLHKTKIIDRITEFRISVDAGSKLVYEKVRIGGNWNVLLENLDFLQESNLCNKVRLIFVVQKNNYLDIPNFEKLCEKYNCVGTLTQLDDWGTWNSDSIETPDQWTLDHGTYKEHNILDSTHPEHTLCKEIVKQIAYKKIKMDPRVKGQLGIV